MTKLYIRTSADNPHRLHDTNRNWFACGQPIVGARAITEAQALVFLENRRCPGCFPAHSQHEGHVHRRAA